MKKFLKGYLIILASVMTIFSVSSCKFFDDGDDNYEYGKAMVKIESEYNNMELLVTYSTAGLITGYTIKQGGAVNETYAVDYYTSFVRLTAMAGVNTGDVRDVYYDSQGRATTLQNGFTVLREFVYNSSYFLKQEVLYSTSDPLVEYSYNSGTISGVIQYDAYGEELSNEQYEDYEIGLDYNTVGLVFLDILHNTYGNYRPLLAVIGIAGYLPTNFSGIEGRYSGFQYDVDGYITNLVMTIDGTPYDVKFTYE